ncbi:hypothetical protein F1737_01475 [Methanoplanus sp. FWC-SCC4]|uniref:Uncharacterized protein n=1 Tax=Methanochimaera problematica TaxID=2609417 RepID=A0AA97FDG0_9EURY|nr:hypothetical protein [Methanoplanus sp. FWC-SCC4]WOF15441.1 hypothetical protein F1737_01475 [Methanoplanus sp. FWC-SCC4]
MSNSKSNRDMIVETNRDVKWICKTLAEMKESIGDHENRIRSLEGSRSESTGWERQIYAGVGAGAGGVVAVFMKIFGGF